MDRDLTYRKLVALVTEYLDGTLPERDGCEGYVEQIRTTVALTERTHALEQRPEITGLLAALRGYRRSA